MERVAGLEGRVGSRIRPIPPRQESTCRHYRTLRLRPEHFTCYLTDSVGFTSYRLLTHTGNKRPVYLFHKGLTQRK